MHAETAAVELVEFYEGRCKTHGWAFDELFRLTARLTGWPLPIAFLFCARIFEQEFLFFTHRMNGSARPRLPHAGRFEITFNPELN
jgi:hypothetical protein